MIDGHIVIAFEYTGVIIIYDPVNEKRIRTLSGVLNCFNGESEGGHDCILEILADGNLAVTDGNNQNVEILKLAN